MGKVDILLGQLLQLRDQIHIHGAAVFLGKVAYLHGFQQDVHQVPLLLREGDLHLAGIPVLVLVQLGLLGNVGEVVHQLHIVGSVDDESRGQGNGQQPCQPPLHREKPAADAPALPGQKQPAAQQRAAQHGRQDGAGEEADKQLLGHAAQAAGEGVEHGVKADAAVDPDIPPGSEEADECHQRGKTGDGAQKKAACLFQHRSDPDSLACAGCRLLCRFPGGGGAGLFFVFFLTHG